jgi:hypothetical protein
MIIFELSNILFFFTSINNRICSLSFGDTSSITSHIQDSLMSLFQASSINMKIGIIKGEKLIISNIFDQSFQMIN